MEDKSRIMAFMAYHPDTGELCLLDFRGDGKGALLSVVIDPDPVAVEGMKRVMQKFTDDTGVDAYMYEYLAGKMIHMTMPQAQDSQPDFPEESDFPFTED